MRQTSQFAQKAPIRLSIADILSSLDSEGIRGLGAIGATVGVTYLCCEPAECEQ